MREIIFRGKIDDYDHKWVYGSLLSGGCLENKVVRILDNETGDEEDVIPDTVGQFTGDKEFSCDADGNTTAGKKIFDGDILEIVSKEDGNGIYLVFWNDEIGGWDWKHLSGAKPSEDYVDEIKAIGNRWDNPEMLKSKVD